MRFAYPRTTNERAGLTSAMHHFAYPNGVMHCEDVSLEAIAREVGLAVPTAQAASVSAGVNLIPSAPSTFSTVDNSGFPCSLNER